MPTPEWKPSHWPESQPSAAKGNGASKPEDFLLPELPEYEEVTLPSGMKAKLRCADALEICAIAGVLPGRLAALARGETPGDVGPEELVEHSRRIVAALVIEPKFSLHPGPGEFHVRRLRAEDREWLANYFNRLRGGGAAELERFRERASGATSGAGASGGGVQDAAKRDSGD